ncbi:hypothetical protein H7347_09430 [Corynebacterium sp. zg-331]|uniref:hypothetical protein n=1 Tax=unclassified Corynebacterium TaxID=2624378 RepID=UPI00128B4741|nr:MULTISPECIES: hypothetical protein [unclassified Corynebacterium]MBC3186783.1 hypothetical protein [Corynebacterium sp. zg-331]MPV53264.1 hypothetical protein [Corynebacterium sp. zg331]
MQRGKRITKRIGQRIATLTLAITIPFTGLNIAHASTDEAISPAAVGEKFSITSEELSELNQLRKMDGDAPIDASAKFLTLSEDYQLKAYDADGAPIAVEDSPVKAESDCPTIVTYDSAVQNTAQFLTGCAGGVIGYDKILQVLEGRAGKTLS